jgi:hypothetical protein
LAGAGGSGREGCAGGGEGVVVEIERVAGPVVEAVAGAGWDGRVGVEEEVDPADVGGAVWVAAGECEGLCGGAGRGGCGCGQCWRLLDGGADGPVGGQLPACSGVGGIGGPEVQVAGPGGVAALAGEFQVEG